ncbi:MAG: oligosaccharide flippase family protein [Edaphocola sp.]
MRRTFVKNIVFLLLVNLVVKPIWIFAIDRNVQITVGHADYGLYSTLLNFSMVFQVLLDFGLQSYNSRTLAASPGSINSLFPNIMVAKAILSVTYTALTLAIGWLIGFRGFALYLLCILIGVQIMAYYLAYLRSNISALQRFFADSLLSVTDRLVLIIVLGILLFNPYFHHRFSISWMAWAQLAALGMAAFFAFMVCLRLSRLRKAHFDLKKVYVIWRKSLPYALLMFLMAVYMKGDLLLIERLSHKGAYEAGVYAAAYRLLDVGNNVTGVLFAAILLPMFSRMLARKEPIGPLVTLCLQLLLPLSVTVAVCCHIWGNDIMKLQLQQIATTYDGLVFSYLIFAYPGFCFGYIIGTLLTANGNISALIKLSAMAVVFSTTLNWLLIPRYGALAAALVATATQIMVTVGNIVLAKRCVGFQLPFHFLLKLVLFSAIVLAAAWAATFLPAHFIWQILSVAAVAGISMWALGFFPVKKLILLLQNR